MSEVIFCQWEKPAWRNVIYRRRIPLRCAVVRWNDTFYNCLCQAGILLWGNTWEEARVNQNSNPSFLNSSHSGFPVCVGGAKPTSAQAQVMQNSQSALQPIRAWPIRALGAETKVDIEMESGELQNNRCRPVEWWSVTEVTAGATDSS